MMSEKRILICAVVVTYNRYALLKECLDALLVQTYPVDVLVIDNASDDATDKKIESDGYLEYSQLQYVRLEENRGGAGGFDAGMQLAYKQNYKYVWLMDDDAEPVLNTLEILVNAIDKYPNYAAYAPMVQIGTREKHVLSTYGHRGVFDYKNTLPAFQQKADPSIFTQEFAEIDMASFVGILVAKSSIDVIGFPRAEFFIHHDDTEYSLRLAALGKILLCNRGVIYHKEKRQEEKVEKYFLHLRAKRIRFDMLWLKYFGLRNSIHVAIQYSDTKKVYLDIGLLYLEMVKNIFFFDDHKMKRFFFVTHSVLDGIRGNFDNKKPRKILEGEWL